MTQAHPTLLFAFSLMSVIGAMGYLMLGLAVIPRSPTLPRTVRALGSGFCVASACAHLGLSVTLLTEPNQTFGDSAATLSSVLIHASLTACLWGFLFGIYLQTGHWTTSVDDDPEEPTS